MEHRKIVFRNKISFSVAIFLWLTFSYRQRIYNEAFICYSPRNVLKIHEIIIEDNRYTYVMMEVAQGIIFVVMQNICNEELHLKKNFCS